MKQFNKIIFLIFTLIILSGCSSKKDSSFLHSIFQTTGATVVREHTEMLKIALINYKLKLNKRNPNHYAKEYDKIIIKQIKESKDTITLPLLEGKEDLDYRQYLNIAFSKKSVKNRNDYLILGIYKLLFWAYSIDKSHKITTLQYYVKKIQKANEIMQVIQYRVQKSKDANGNFLFLTWQRKWQIEVLKNLNNNQKVNFNAYTNKQLLYHSNMSFQVTTSNMIFIIGETLRYLGSESKTLGVQAIKSVLMFL